MSQALSSKIAPVAMGAAALVLVMAGIYVLRGGNTKPTPSPTPSVRAKPTREQLDRTIERGTRAYIDTYAKTAFDHVANGGWVDYTDAAGKTTRLGPNVYVACDLYLLIHYLMYNDWFGIPADEPFLLEIRKWLIDQFDAEAGHWLWSHEGCLHCKGMTALARHGRTDLVDKAWAWARQSPLWLPDDRMFTMMQSGNIIQTLGQATLSLNGAHDWEHGSPVPDAESSTKFLYAILEAGHTIDEPEVAELNDGIDDYFENNPLIFAEMNTRDVVGMAWYVFATHRFDLPRREGYTFCVNTMRQSVRHANTLEKHALTRHFYALRGLVIRALLLAGEHTDAMDEQIAIFLEKQNDDGAWPLTDAAKKAWGLDKRPVIGKKMGQMDGANTYLTTLTLIAYRDAVFGKPETDADDVQTSDRSEAGTHPTATQP